MKTMPFTLLLLLLQLTIVSSQTFPPTWTANQYVQAGRSIVAQNYTGTYMNTITSITITYSSALSGIGELAYGIQTYEGYDYIGEEIFEYHLTGSSSSSASFEFIVQGTTKLVITELAYFVVDPTFPHHYNTFLQFDIGFENNISNITTKSTTMQTYTNSINYTLQASGRTHNTFSTPLTNTKIIIFITGIGIDASHDMNLATKNPIDLQITANIISTSHYEISARFGIKIAFSKVNLCQIVVDTADVASSDQYQIVTSRYDVVVWDGGILEIQPQFQNSFIISLTDFSSNQSSIHFIFSWQLETSSGVFGAYFQPSNATTFTRLGTTYLYIKTWICPYGFFYNSTNEMCTFCFIENCLDCSSGEKCAICDEANGYFLNETSHLCELCANTVENCLQCSSFSSCSQCDYQNNFYLTQNSSQSNFTCAFCNNSLNHFINQSQTCEECLLSNCLVCANLQECSFCNQTMSYFLNNTDLLCYQCQIFQCILCETLYECQQCNETDQYFLNITDKQCIPCTLEGCVNCSSLSSCYECNSSDYGFSNINPLICSSCNESCTCDGYYFPWDNTALKCSSVCGDDVIRLSEECDDGNNASLDGCSANCQVEDFYICYNQPSFCFIDLNFTITYLRGERIGCNQFTIELQINPKLPDFAEENLLQTISIDHENISFFNETYDDETGIITINSTYEGDITDGIIHFNQHLVMKIQLTYTSIIPAVFYSSQECSTVSNIEFIIFIAKYVTFGIMAFGFLLRTKIIGLQLFGVFQLAYFSLISHQYYDLYLAPFSQEAIFNGFNVQLIKQAQIPSHISQLSLYVSFLNNFNIMFLGMLAVACLGLLFHAISAVFHIKVFNKGGKMLLKEGLVTLIIFNCFNIGFSAGIHWKYSSTYQFQFSTESSILLYVSLFFVLCTLLSLQLSSGYGFGEYKKKYKKNAVCRSYIAITIIFRITTGIYASLQNENQFTTVVIIAFPLAFVMYNMINLPFKNVFQNYRSNIVHVTQFIIFMTTNYYRSMKSTTPISVKSHYHGVAMFQITAICACIIFSVIATFSEVYELVQQCQRINRKKKPKEVAEETLEDFGNVFDN